MNWAVLCDFDHTITKEDVTDQLLEKYALPQWRHVETLWEQGHMGSLDCMRQQIELVRATKMQVEEMADNIAVDAHFKEFAALCSKKHIPLVIVSDGLDYVIEYILNRHSIPHTSIISSHLKHLGEDRWQLDAPYSSADCSSKASTCKCEVSRRFRASTGAEKILYIGDGRSDYCVSLQEADFILAKSSLLTYCQQQQLPHRAFATFAQAAKTLNQLLSQHDQPHSSAEEALYA